MHTTGFGSKLVHQIGYTCGKLSKYEQCIVNIIEPEIRPMKLGFVYFETSSPNASLLYTSNL
jgi:hypothetical protein